MNRCRLQFWVANNYPECYGTQGCNNDQVAICANQQKECQLTENGDFACVGGSTQVSRWRR